MSIRWCPRLAGPAAVLALAGVLGCQANSQPRLITPAPVGFESLAFTRDGSRLAAGRQSTVKIWDPASGAEVATLSGDQGTVVSVSYSPDGKRLAAGDTAMAIKVWNVETGQLEKTLTGHKLQVTCAAFSPDGQHVASSAGDEAPANVGRYEVKVWDLAKDGAVTDLKTGHKGVVHVVAYTPDGARLATGSHDYTIRLWDAATLKLLKTFQGHDNIIYSIAFSPDGKTMATGSFDKTVKLWDVETGQEKATLKGHTDHVGCVAYAPDGRTVASGSDDHTIKVWDTATGKELATFTGHTRLIRGLAFGADANTLASASDDGTVLLWDVAKKQARVIGK